jgi:hypothetical protein
MTELIIFAFHQDLCDDFQNMQTLQNVIKTKVDPKDFRANYRTIKVRDGEFETTATTEIINEDIDLATGTFTMEVALYYQRGFFGCLRRFPG